MKKNRGVRNRGMLIILLLPALWAMACSAESSLVDQVRCTELEFSKSAETRNLGKFKSMLDEDARFIGQTVYRGKDEIFSAWSVFFEESGPRILWRPVFVEVLEGEGLALTRGYYKILGPDDDGGEIVDWGTFNSVWRRQRDGDWLVVFDSGVAGQGQIPDSVKTTLETVEFCEAVE